MAYYLVTWSARGTLHEKLCATRDDAERYVALLQGLTHYESRDHAVLALEDSPKVLELLIQAHDLTYMMSDDHQVWQRGAQSYNAIVACKDRLIAAGHLTPQAFAALWNRWVDGQGMTPPHNTLFHWKD